jgi:exodeoxyribonuclease-3
VSRVEICRQSSFSQKRRRSTTSSGRRLDHVWVTPALATKLSTLKILRESRGWMRPSDHVPVTVTLEA